MVRIKKLRFLYILLTILVLICFYPTNTLSAAPINHKYQNFSVNSDNETPFEYPVWQLSQEEALQGMYINYSLPIYDSFSNRTIPKTPSPILLSPSDCSINILVNQIIFSWSPFKENTKYILALANDAVIETHIIDLAEVTTTNYPYKYDRTLDYNTVYFWQVMALDPMKSEWSSVFSFRTEAAAPPVSTPPLPAATPQPNPLPMTPIIIMIITLIAAFSLVTWLIIIKYRLK